MYEISIISMKMRSAGVTLISMALTAAVIGNAFYQKKQFYPSVVYITKSNPCMAVIYIQAFVLVILMGKLMRKVFFGQLRAAEFEHLMERSWYAVTETCLAFTVFRDDFSPKFVALFTVLLFLKSFHWLAEDRVDFVTLLAVLGALDFYFVCHAYQSTVTKGASVQLVFGFEYAILLTIILNIGIKYVLHTMDLRSDNPWENKAVFLLYTELAMGFIKVILYVLFVAIMVRIYTLPLFAFRPMYYTMRAFNKAFNDVILSRRAIRNMNTLYPDATPEELSAADNVCIICREEMVTASKKLPCNHIFHTSCLRSWFQRQQTCPTCRLNILQAPVPVQQPANQQQQQQQGQQQQQPPGVANMGIPMPGQPAPAQPQGGVNPFLPMMPGGFPGAGMMPPFWQPFQVPPPAQQQHHQAAAPMPQQAGQDETPGTHRPTVLPPPLPSRDWSGLSYDELRALEGSTREAVEARLRALHQVLLLLDAAAVMANQCATATPHPTTSSGDQSEDAAEGEVASTSSASQTEQPRVFNESPEQNNRSGSSSTDDSQVSLEHEEVRRRRLQKFSAAPPTHPE
ncbi:hypothetical protein B566_EDAN008905 [Ephemera danica]|nr:hypothetical protein B566_EDAN008905 [Ephemera danica]